MIGNILILAILAFIIKDAAATIHIKAANNITQEQKVQAISDLQEMAKFSEYLSVPKKVNIYLQNKSYDIYYQASHSLYLSRQMLNQDNYVEAQTYKKTLPVWAHEYAHSVFNESLAKKSDRFKKILEYFKKREELKIKIKKSYRLYPKRLYDQYLKIEAVIAAIISDYNRLAAYDELFADIFAVLYFNDPKAITKSFTYSTMSDLSKYYAKERDFTEYQNPDTFTPTDHLGHDYLWPARYEFWQKVKSCPRTDRKILLKQAFDAIAIETLYALEHDIKPPRDANRDMIKRFKAEIVCQ